MKRIFFALICLMFSLTGSAQPKSFGLRAGLEYQLSYEHRVTTHGDFIEMDLGYQLLGNGLNVACAYDFMVARPKWTRRGEWGFYVGPAVKVGHLWVGTYISAGAVKRISKCPCNGCTDRWVKDGHRCHSTCKRYARWRSEVDAVAELNREERNRTSDADRISVEKCVRYKKAINRIPKKKG